MPSGRINRFSLSFVHAPRSRVVWALAADGHIPITPDVDTGISKRTFFSPRRTADVTCTLEQY